MRVFPCDGSAGPLGLADRQIDFSQLKSFLILSDDDFSRLDLEGGTARSIRIIPNAVRNETFGRGSLYCERLIRGREQYNFPDPIRLQVRLV
jgi:hypothetical protein